MADPSFRVFDRLAGISQASWDALVPPGGTPFVRHAWLNALEESGCAGPDAGWTPRHLTLWRGPKLVAAAPAYVKEDSDGDFARDWDWASAAARAGLAWFPKLSITVPFTPATGKRLLVAAGEDREASVRALLAGADALCKEEGIATIQVLFAEQDEMALLASAGMAERVSHQFHWHNRAYGGFDDYLARFNSKRRAMIKRERAAPAAQGIEIRTIRGAELAAESKKWGRTAYQLHRHTVDKLMWGRRWLDQGFYDRAFQSMPDALEVVAAFRGGKVVAGAFNVASATHLYGRYWGAFEEHPFLHFNVCLYHSVEDCIARGLQVFEGGAGGEHKLPRGFEPALTHSAYRALDPRLDQAVRRQLAAETAERTAAVEHFRAESGIFKKEARGDPAGEDEK